MYFSMQQRIRFIVEVKSGQDGKKWSIHKFAGAITFMTMPSILADSPANMLLPREIVESDAGGGVQH